MLVGGTLAMYTMECVDALKLQLRSSTLLATLRVELRPA